MKWRASLIRHKLTDEWTSSDEISSLVRELQAGVRELWKDRNSEFSLFQDMRDNLVRHIAIMAPILYQHDFLAVSDDAPVFAQDVADGLLRFIRGRGYEAPGSVPTRRSR